MKAWNFKVCGSPKGICDKLELTLGSVSGIVFNMESNQNDSVTFKVRKKILYAWYILFQNYVIVKGNISKTTIEDETSVHISFKMHFLMILIILTYMLFFFAFLIMIISEITSSILIYIIGGILLAAGILLWGEFRKRTNKKVQEYKTLISEILQLNKEKCIA